VLEQNAAKAATPAPDAPAPDGGPVLRIEVFSERAIIIKGDTKPHKDRIKACVPNARAIWHRTAAGWIFSKRHEAAVRSALADLLAITSAA
jgi:hypothetical protein